MQITQKPNPERQLILISAATAARRCELAATARSLGAQVDWGLLTEVLRIRKLLPVLGPRIVELTVGTIPAGFAADVDDAVEAARRQGAFLQLTGQQAMAMLAGAGIRSAALKGPQFSEAIYGDPGRRISSDIDLLVAPEDLQAAVAVVRELGYDAPADPVSADGLPRLHFALGHERGALPPIELHWRVHWYEERFAAERLLCPVGADPLSWRPQPADELASLLLFYARDGFVDLRLAADIAAWCDKHGEQLRRDDLERLLDAYPALARVLPAAAVVAERIVGVPATSLTARSGKLDRRERLAVRLANPHPRQSQSQIYADRGLVDGLLGPKGSFRSFVRRQLLPPREVLVQHAGHAEREKVRSSLGRLFGVLGRYGISLVRILRPGETLPEASR